MTAIEEMVHGLPRPTVWGTVNYLDHDTSEDKIIEFYQACGFGSNANERVHQFHLPPIEYLARKPNYLGCSNILTRKL